MSGVVLEIQNLSKSFGSRKVVDNVSLSVNEGEVFGFLGPNGAGKTTTIKMILGLLSIDSGKVLINGYNVRRQFEVAMPYIGGIVENPEMYKFLSGRTCLKMYGRMQKNVTDERIDEVVKFVGLENRIGDKVKKYSLGMKQRLGIAQSILHRPKVLILDEPTNGLDPSGIREIRETVKQLAHQEGVTVFVSSHLLAEMQMMCDRVAVINNGKLLSVQTVEEITKSAVGGAGSVYKIGIRPFDKALAMLEAQMPHKVVAADRALATVDLAMGEEEIVRLNKLIYENGLAIYSMNAIQSSLEDVFLKMVGGGQIA